MKIFADLHIHIGVANGNYIKIPSSNRMNLLNIMETSYYYKGLQCIGIVDSLCDDVLLEIDYMLNNGVLIENDKGIFYKQLLIILGFEFELKIESKYVHFVILFNTRNQLLKFKNLFKYHFSSFKYSCPQYIGNIFTLVNYLNNENIIVFPAHIFTPYKGIYSAIDKISSLNYFNLNVIELGLSADAFLASYISELNKMVFLSNSDAHSLNNIAREFNEIDTKDLSVYDVIKAINKNKIISNYGIIPELGKYHLTYCNNCNKQTFLNNSHLCSRCNSNDYILGVLERINNLADIQFPNFKRNYKYLIPFNYIRGMGEKTIDKLVSFFGTEINAYLEILRLYNENKLEDLKEIIGNKNVLRLNNFLSQKYEIIYGSGGFFGTIIT